MSETVKWLYGAEGEQISFSYRNYRGEISSRKVKVIGIAYGKTQYHPDEQWLLHGIQDDGSERMFSMRDMWNVIIP